MRPVQARQLDDAFHFAVRIAVHHLRIAEARADAPLEQPDRFQRAQRRSLHRDADAEHIPRRMQLDEVDLDVRALERGREHHAREARTDDQHFHWVS